MYSPVYGPEEEAADYLECERIANLPTPKDTITLIALAGDLRVWEGKERDVGTVDGAITKVIRVIITR